MKRRDFLSGAAVLLVGGRAAGQPSGEAMRRIAILEPGSRAMRAQLWAVLEERLRQHGYVERKNLSIERRWADGVDARLPQLAKDLLAGSPEVIVTITTPAVQSLKRLTHQVPIVMIVSDAVATGLVASLARPGANVTGISLDLIAVARKRLQLLREINPEARRVGHLGPATNAGVQAAFKQVQAAGAAMGVEVRLVDAADGPTIARAFEQLVGDPVDALLVTQVMLQHYRQIVELAARYRVPAAYVDEEPLAAGGLLVFGPERDAPYRHAADYVHRILEGTKPADMPVMQPTEYWLGVNLTTARALGIKIPQSVLIRADRVIE
jgi:putative ABC transport system substrate-binding protein